RGEKVAEGRMRGRRKSSFLNGVDPHPGPLPQPGILRGEATSWEREKRPLSKLAASCNRPALNSERRAGYAVPCGPRILLYRGGLNFAGQVPACSRRRFTATSLFPLRVGPPFTPARVLKESARRWMLAFGIGRPFWPPSFPEVSLV